MNVRTGMPKPRRPISASSTSACRTAAPSASCAGPERTSSLFPALETGSPRPSMASAASLAWTILRLASTRTIPAGTASSAASRLRAVIVLMSRMSANSNCPLDVRHQQPQGLEIVVSHRSCRDMPAKPERAVGLVVTCGDDAEDIIDALRLGPFDKIAVVLPELAGPLPGQDRGILKAVAHHHFKATPLVDHVRAVISQCREVRSIDVARHREQDTARRERLNGEDRVEAMDRRADPAKRAFPARRFEHAVVDFAD